MWSKDQVSKFKRALGTVAKNRAALEKLEQMSKLSPALAQQVAELKARADYIETMSKLALDLDEEGEASK